MSRRWNSPASTAAEGGLARAEDGEPVWFERGFRFRMGAHAPRDDVQLTPYAVAAREAWKVDSERQSYRYVLADSLVFRVCHVRLPDRVSRGRALTA